jgi:antirestriction protein ArdC
MKGGRININTRYRQKTVYEIVTEKIIDKLRDGVIPWRKPWNSDPAQNWKSRRPYSGINALLLDPGEYATWNQIKEAGGKVKKGAKGNIVVFWKLLDSKDDEDDKKKIPFLRYYKVWEINSQVEGLESRRKEKRKHHDPIAEAEKIKEGYRDCPAITFGTSSAFYRPADDTISVPEISDFDKAEEFYSSLFHEMIHSTGHKDRLNRSGIAEKAAFGSEKYSKEELVAEIGAAMLCGTAGIEQVTLDNSAAYIKSWLRVLKEDSKLVVFAASAAQKAADYILGVEREGQE